MIKVLFEKIYSNESLTLNESRNALLSIMQGDVEPSLIGAFLTALHMKGETADEIAGFALAMTEKSVRLPVNGKHTIDTCGTGGDKKGSFNISTLAAFVLAGCEVPVVKHGNRAASSACGSADLLEALGIRFRLNPDEAMESLELTGFTFLFAPDYHPATKQVANIRKQLGVPTLFNLLGPLTNPARPSAQLIGVYDPRALTLMAEACLMIDPQRRLALVHAEQGWDEATPVCDILLHSVPHGPSRINAAYFGLSKCMAGDLEGGKPSDNALIATNILDGEKGSRRDTVLMNAALALMVFSPEYSPREAIQLAAESLDSGAAKNVVTKLKMLFPGDNG